MITIKQWTAMLYVSKDEPEDTSRFGIVLMDETNRIIDFEEAGASQISYRGFCSLYLQRKP